MQQCPSQAELQLPASGREHRTPQSSCGVLGRICWPGSRCAPSLFSFATLAQHLAPCTEQWLHTAPDAGPVVGALPLDTL